VPVKYWTVDEARAELPRVRELVERIKRAADTGAQVRGNGQEAPAADAADALAELEADDIILRDPHAGLIDFRAVGSDGVVYLLCWRLGEDDLEWWHMPDAGFAGRQRLPRETE
jgi:hypothetical protein